MQIEVFKIIPTSREDTQIAEGQFIEINDEEIIKLGKRYFALTGGLAFHLQSQEGGGEGDDE